MTDRSEKTSKRTFLELIYNPMSLMGLLFAGFGVGMIIIFTVLDVLFGDKTHYVGTLVFLIFPPFVLLGAVLVFWGNFRFQKKLLRMGHVEAPLAKLDLNVPNHRKYLLIFMLTSFFVVCIIGVSSYQGFHYTESVDFCSSCHSVMAPESITHQTSPHARVTCVECHVGSGAGWYVKSKMSGLYQVYSVFAKKYPKPIPTPIHSLRPARDTCEQCHWPDFFIDDRVQTLNYFLTDDENTPGRIDLLMKIGGQPEFGKPKGIHWHVQNEVTFIARDERHEDIPWVQVTDQAGNVEVFETTDEPLTREEIESMPRITMDCIDCHNRPSHSFESPTDLMNTLLYTKRVDPTIPGIRRIGAESLVREYESVDQAVSGIRDYILEEYEGEDDILDAKGFEINNAIEAIVGVYKSNFFPSMKTRWDVHPSNIGHMISPGCFRCHDDNHVTRSGKSITRECNQCHFIVAQGKHLGDEEVFYDPRGLDFIHPDPEDVDDDWETELCSDCHTGEE